MADVDVARNLLFGAIALQRDFIDLSQLTKACTDWTPRMQDPLADLLVERGWITAEERCDIERDLERKLKKHKGDVQASLGVVAGADVRDAIRMVDHPEIRKSLRGLPPAAGDVLVETVVRPNAEQRSRYTLVRLHAEGGLGKVWIARDGDLNREVALKEIKTERADHPDAWRRFLKEAQITGQLEHPNIVPVYELARRKEDDQPFYVMRFVRGQTLRDAIADHHRRRGRGPADPLELQKLLGAFTGISQAIGYAHSRGVVHRDLKPENVVLGGFGEVIVLDWGLAKMVDRPDEEAPEVAISVEATTQTTVAAVGTPEYMAPEQVEARHDLIDSRTDIYGLGAILFEILTGRPPFEGTQVEVYNKIRNGETPRARAVEPTVPKPLDAICAKAMARARGGRYAKAVELAEDVQRWIAGEPVGAWREPWTLRTRRWMAKHRTLVTSAAVALVVGLAAAGYVLYDARLRAEQRLAQANGRVDALATAEIREVPGIIEQLQPDRRLVLDRLRTLARTDPTSSSGRRRLHAALALLPNDPTQMEVLAGRLQQADVRPDVLIVIRQALQDHGHAAALTPKLWDLLKSTGTELTDPQLRAAGALALFDPKHPRWPALGPPVAAKLVKENPLLIGDWREAFQPVSGALAGPLRAIYGHRDRPEERALAYTLLFEFATQADNPNQPEDLADLIAEADPEQFRRVLGQLTDRQRAIARLESQLGEPARFDDALARRQGQMATALVILGRSDRVWPLFKHTDDPSVRTELIHDLAKFGADPHEMVNRLDREPDVSARRALILSLGEFPADRLSVGERQALVAKLVRWYHDDPDPGVHGGIDWLLRQRWDQAQELDRIDKELAGPDLPKDRDWYVNGQGQTFAVIRGPVEFRMGSTEQSDPERERDEVQHLRRIDRSFAIATREVTVAEYARFLDEGPAGVTDWRKDPQFKQYIPSLDCAIGAVTWYEAARYCNWLSAKEGIPEERWCYPREIGPGMKLPRDYLRRTGYRLPTEAEWEYACRAGAASSRPYGGAVSWLGEYGWYVEYSGRTMHPVGKLKPNDLGLFDILGNAVEWCSDAYTPYLKGTEFSDNISRVLRGSAFINPAPYLRSAYRSSNRPADQNNVIGFRLARTPQQTGTVPSAHARIRGRTLLPQSVASCEVQVMDPSHQPSIGSRPNDEPSLRVR